MIKFLSDNNDFLPSIYNEVILYDDSTIPSSIIQRAIFKVDEPFITNSLIRKHLDMDMMYRYVCYRLFPNFYKNDNYSWRYVFNSGTLYGSKYSDYQYNRNRKFIEEDVRQDIRVIMEGEFDI